MPIGGSAIAGIAGAAKLISGAVKQSRDKAELSQLKDPFYKIQNEYYQNRDIAANLAGQGLTSAERNYATTNNERGLSAGISATLQGGGNVNNIASLNSGYYDANSRLAAQDAAKHIENIQYFMGANKDLAGQKTTQWGLNVLDPYRNKLASLTERKAADEKSMWNGVDDVVGSVGAGIQYNQNKDLYNSLFGNSKPTSDDSANAAYQQWSQQQDMNNAPTYNAQPTQGKFADGSQRNFTIPDDYYQNLLPPNFLNRPI